MDKTTRETMFSSKDLEWGTPQHFFHRLEDKFGTFTLDPCSNNSNLITLPKRMMGFHKTGVGILYL
jgi:hypothetical protein